MQYGTCKSSLALERRCWVHSKASGAFWSRWRLKRQADLVLQLARTANGARLSRHQFFVLVETLRELSAAIKDGRLALLVEGKNVRQM